MNLQAKLMMSALCIGALPLAQAADFEDFGKVVRVVPQVEQINRPRQECRTEYVQVQAPPQQRSAGGSIVGGIAGALLGNTIGSGGGRTAATVAGAVAGGVVGNQVEGRRQQAQAYQISVRLDNGEYRTVVQDSAADLRPGNRVRVVDGRVYRY